MKTVSGLGCLSGVSTNGLKAAAISPFTPSIAARLSLLSTIVGSRRYTRTFTRVPMFVVMRTRSTHSSHTSAYSFGPTATSPPPPSRSASTATPTTSGVDREDPRQRAYLGRLAPRVSDLASCAALVAHAEKRPVSFVVVVLEGCTGPRRVSAEMEKRPPSTRRDCRARPYQWPRPARYSASDCRQASANTRSSSALRRRSIPRSARGLF